jgi:hypothetical protein
VALAFSIELAARQPFGCSADKDLCHTDLVESFGDSDYSDKAVEGAGDSAVACVVDKGDCRRQIENAEVEWGGAEAEAETEAILFRLKR